MKKFEMYLKKPLVPEEKDAIPCATRAPGVIRDMDQSNRIPDKDIIKCYLHAGDDFEFGNSMAMNPKSPDAYIYAVRPPEDVNLDDLETINLYTFDMLHMCPGWTDTLYASMSTTAKFRTTLDRFFIRCGYSDVVIPRSKYMYAVIKASTKDETKMTANITIPFEDGFGAQSRMFYFPAKTWTNVAPGLACVWNAARRENYGFIDGSMAKTSINVGEPNSPNAIADLFNQIPSDMALRHPSLAMDVVTIGPDVKLALVYPCTYPRSQNITPLMVMFHDEVDNANIIMTRPNEMILRGFTKNMLATIYSCKTDITSYAVYKEIIAMNFGKTLVELHDELVAVRCKYQSKFNPDRFCLIDDEIPWAYDDSLRKALKIGLLRQLSLDGNVAKMLDINNINSVVGLTAEEYDTVVKSVGVFNEIANEEIIRLGRRNKIKIDNQ